MAIFKNVEALIECDCGKEVELTNGAGSSVRTMCKGCNTGYSLVVGSGRVRIHNHGIPAQEDKLIYETNYKIWTQN